MIESAPSIDITKKVRDALSAGNPDKFVGGINNDYLYWDKVKHLLPPAGMTHKEWWTLVKMVRVFNRRMLDFTLPRVSFSIYITDSMQQALHEFDMNIGGYLGTRGLIPEEDKHRYLVSSIMEEAIASSQMEGAATTRRQAKDMLRKQMKPKNRSEQMIVNNFSTITHVAENKDDRLTPEGLLRIHKLITNNTLDNPDEEGQFRDSNDIYVVNHLTSEAVHTPPNTKDLPDWITELCAFFNDEIQSDNLFVHPIVKGIIIHFLIGYIHPFCDGNGRTARALFYWYLLKKGYWLTEYLSISRIIYKSKAQYERAFIYTEIDDNDLSYFIQYNLNVMGKAFDALREYIELKLKDQRQTAEFIKITPINERQAVLLKLLSDRPQLVLTIKEAKNRFGVSYQTARTDILGLVDLGLLTAIPVNKIKQNYVRPDDFESRLKALKNV